jgi:hypothetical protein
LKPHIVSFPELESVFPVKTVLASSSEHKKQLIMLTTINDHANQFASTTFEVVKEGVLPWVYHNLESAIGTYNRL